MGSRAKTFPEKRMLLAPKALSRSRGKDIRHATTWYSVSGRVNPPIQEPPSRAVSCRILVAGVGHRAGACKTAPGARHVSPHHLSLRGPELQDRRHQNCRNERECVTDCPRGYSRTAQNGTRVDLRFRAVTQSGERAGLFSLGGDPSCGT